LALVLILEVASASVSSRRVETSQLLSDLEPCSSSVAVNTRRLAVRGLAHVMAHQGAYSDTRHALVPSGKAASPRSCLDPFMHPFLTNLSGPIVAITSSRNNDRLFVTFQHRWKNPGFHVALQLAPKAEYNGEREYGSNVYDAINAGWEDVPYGTWVYRRRQMYVLELNGIVSRVLVAKLPPGYADFLNDHLG